MITTKNAVVLPAGSIIADGPEVYVKIGALPWPWRGLEGDSFSDTYMDGVLEAGGTVLRDGWGSR